MKKYRLKRARLKECLSYDPDSGAFHYIGDYWPKRRGKRAGALCANGVSPKLRRYISIDGERISAARLAWFYMKGKWPKADVDHIDLDTLNDAFTNLRPCTRSQNIANKHGGSKTGLKGAYRKIINDREFYESSISFKRKIYYLGYFNSKEEAHSAYAKAAKRLHGKFAKTTCVAKSGRWYGIKARYKNTQPRSTYMGKATSVRQLIPS